MSGVDRPIAGEKGVVEATGFPMRTKLEDTLCRDPGFTNRGGIRGGVPSPHEKPSGRGGVVLKWLKNIRQHYAMCAQRK